MSTVKGRFWYGSHLCHSKIYPDAEQQAVYKAVLTIVNEHSQMVTQWFTHTTSLYEVRKGLRLLRDRYKGEDVEVSTAARSCACCTLHAIAPPDRQLRWHEFISKID